MNHWTMVIFAAALLLGGGTVSAQEEVECKMPNKNANPIAFFSANTNSGKGNGEELALLGAFPVCQVNRPEDDGDHQVGNAHNPVEALGPGNLVATDPGNSPN